MLINFREFQVNGFFAAPHGPPVAKPFADRMAFLTPLFGGFGNGRGNPTDPAVKNNKGFRYETVNDMNAPPKLLNE